MTVSEAYAILGLDSTTVTPSEVRTAFHRFVLRNHPDLVEGTEAKRAATNAMIRLNEAYQAIKDAGFPRFTWSAGTAPPPRDVWQPQHDPGDVNFERWMDGLSFGSEHAYYDPMSELSPVESAFMVPIGMAIGIAILFLLYFRLLRPIFDFLVSIGWLPACGRYDGDCAIRRSDLVIGFMVFWGMCIFLLHKYKLVPTAFAFVREWWARLPPE